MTEHESEKGATSQPASNTAGSTPSPVPASTAADSPSPSVEHDIVPAEARSAVTDEPRSTSSWEKIVASCAALLILGLVAFVVIRNERFADQNTVVMLRIIISVAAAILGAAIPGFLHIEWKGGGAVIRSGGALALGVLTFLWTPTVIQEEDPPPPPPPMTRFSEAFSLGARADTLVNNVLIKIGFIGISGSSLFADVTASVGNFTDSGRFTEGNVIPIIVDGCSDLKLYINGIDMVIPPWMTEEGMREYPFLAEAVITRTVSLTLMGACTEDAL